MEQLTTKATDSPTRPRRVLLWLVTAAVLIGAVAVMFGGSESPMESASPPNATSAAGDILVVEGTLVNRFTRDAKDHPAERPGLSEDPVKAAGKKTSDKGGLIVAHLELAVSRWVTGTGPDRITLVAPVDYPGKSRIYQEPSLDTSVYNSLQQGRLYRFEVKKSTWFSGAYYDFAVANVRDVMAGTVLDGLEPTATHDPSDQGD